MEQTLTFTQTTLDNGLTVFLKEIHTAPLISHWIWYRVGSRDEVPGKTGVSHWVEHMLFKGTPRFPSSDLDKLISRVGGSWNAYTYLDWTAFFEKLPADEIDLALDLEADRMQHCHFDPEEVESERTVIISEREGHENSPYFRLDEAMQNQSFDQHPYRNEVIGEKADLHALTRDDLYNHYRTYYHPGNAVLAIAGDFETQAMLAKIEKYYAGIPTGLQPPRPAELEAPLTQERRVEVTGPEETILVQFSYRAPAATQPDFFTMTILDSLLSGPSSLNMFGGGRISNKTSRLYRALVETGLAVAVSGGMRATTHPFLYDINLVLPPGTDTQPALQAVDEQIQRLQNELVSQESVQRALKQARAMFAYGSENITNQAFWMGYANMFGKYDWFLNYVNELEKATPESILEAAQTWLNPARRVVGTYLPENGAGGAA